MGSGKENTIVRLTQIGIIGLAAVAGVNGIRFIDDRQASDSTPTGLSAPLEPKYYSLPTSTCENPIYKDYKSYCSPDGFEINYPNHLKQRGRNSFEPETGPEDFHSRVSVKKTPKDKDIIETPPLIDSNFINKNENARRERFTLENISGMNAVRSDYIIPKRENAQDPNGFEEEIKVITYTLLVRQNGEIVRYDIEFAAPSSVFSKQFPEDEIEKTANSFKLTYEQSKAALPPPPLPTPFL